MDSKHVLWLPPWQQAGPGLETELAREVGLQHLLYGVQAVSVARKADQDDVLFALADRAELLAVVHLTWSGRREKDPRWPETVLFSRWEQWIERSLIPDHLQFCGDEPDWLGVLTCWLRIERYDEAEAFAAGAPVGWQRAEAWSRIAKNRARDDNLLEAQRMWGLALREARMDEDGLNPQDSLDASSVLREIAADMALTGDLQQARKIAGEIRNPSKREGALQIMAEIQKKLQGD